MPNMHRRDFLQWAGLTASGLLLSRGAWAFTKLVPGDEPLAARPYREWEDVYRGRWTWDAVAPASHCSNCAGNCAWNVYVKDGVVLREEQMAAYPRTSEGAPDFNPRGCQKGAVHGAAMYDADRLRHPMKRVGERGAGKWKRLSWDEALSEIAEKVVDLHEASGPGAIVNTAGSGIQADIRQAATLRFAALTGSVHRDVTTVTADVPTGIRLAYGRSWQCSGTTDRLFHADYILLHGCNPSVTRIPDAHFLWEARYDGCRVVSVVPDLNPSAIHADLWLPIRQGSDPFLMMSMIHVVIDEDLVARDFVREQTDLPLLVRRDDRRLLRQSDLEPGGREDVFYVWDRRSGRAVAAPGSEGSAEKTLRMEGVDVALEGEYVVGGVAVSPAFEFVRAEAMKFSPETTEAETGIRAAIVRREARAFAKAKIAIIKGGFALPKYSNGLLTLWAQSLLMALTGHGGPTGEIQYMGVHFKRPGIEKLALPKYPRIETGMGEWLESDQHEVAKKAYDQKTLKERLGYDVDEIEAMARESVAKGWMPHWGKPKGMIVWADNLFRRNKAVHVYRERILEQASALYVNVNFRMDSSARFADYVLPAASHYEAWETRHFPFHVFLNVSAAPVAPIDDAKPDWDIAALLCRKIQEVARARKLAPFEDPAFGCTRDFATLWDDFTMNGAVATAEDAARWLVENSPELGGQSLEDGARRGFFVMNDEVIGPNHARDEKGLIVPWAPQVVDKKPYPTLSGRITFYIDHEWFLKLETAVPTARRHAGRECTKHPLGFYSPHTRWGIHSNWRSNEYILRLHRGEPYVYVNPKVAKARGIADGDRVRVFNEVGAFHAQAKYYPSLPETAIMMEHAWEPYQFGNGEALNNVTAPMLQPLEMVGNWGHLKFEYFDFNPNQMAHTSGVEIERVSA